MKVFSILIAVLCFGSVFSCPDDHIAINKKKLILKAIQIQKYEYLQKGPTEGLEPHVIRSWANRIATLKEGIALINEDQAKHLKASAEFDANEEKVVNEWQEMINAKKQEIAELLSASAARTLRMIARGNN